MTNPDSADLTFVRAMVKHHVAALEMAMERIQNSGDGYVLHAATRIMGAQSSEIDEFRSWLAAHEQD